MNSDIENRLRARSDAEECEGEFERRDLLIEAADAIHELNDRLIERTRALLRQEHLEKRNEY